MRMGFGGTLKKLELVQFVTLVDTIEEMSKIKLEKATFLCLYLVAGVAAFNIAIGGGFFGKGSFPIIRSLAGVGTVAALVMAYSLFLQLCRKEK